MAARKTRTLTQTWKDKIQTTMLIKRLQDHGEGKVDLLPTQVRAIEILLKKVTPDLSSVAVGQDEALGPIKISWDDK